MLKLPVHLGRYLHEPQRERAVRRHLHEIVQTLSIAWRIPLDDDELGVETGQAALRVKGIDERLQAPQRVAAVIVVAGHHNNAEIGCIGLRHRLQATHLDVVGGHRAVLDAKKRFADAQRDHDREQHQGCGEQHAPLTLNEIGSSPSRGRQDR